MTPGRFTTIGDGHFQDTGNASVVFLVRKKNGSPRFFGEFSEALAFADREFGDAGSTRGRLHIEELYFEERPGLQFTFVRHVAPPVDVE